MENYKPKRISRRVLRIVGFPEDVWTLEDLQVYVSLKKHLTYKTHTMIGYILWPLMVFIAPFLIGGFTSLIDYLRLCSTYSNIPSYSFSEFTMDGMLMILLFSFTTPITLPLFFIIGGFIHPMILQLIIFRRSDKYGPEYKYNDEIASYVRCNSKQRTTNLTAMLLPFGFHK